MRVPYISLPVVGDIESLRQSVVNQVNSLIEAINRSQVSTDLDMKGHRVYNVKTPANDLDAVNKRYVDDLVRNLGSGRRVGNTSNTTYTVQIANVSEIVLTANTNITAPIAATEGQILIVFVTQGSGPYTITFDAGDFAPGVNTEISPVNGSVSTFLFIGRNDGIWWPVALGFTGV